MDNTLKLLIAVLSIAGLIALFTPTVDDAPATGTEAAQAANAPAAMPDKVGEPEIVAGEENEEEDVLAGFGEPMNDGKPIDPLKEDEAESEEANSGQASNDAAPQFSPASDGGFGGGASSSAQAPSAPAAVAARPMPEAKPIPNAPPVSNRPSM